MLSDLCSAWPMIETINWMRPSVTWWREAVRSGEYTHRHLIDRCKVNSLWWLYLSFWHDDTYLSYSNTVHYTYPNDYYCYWPSYYVGLNVSISWLIQYLRVRLFNHNNKGSRTKLLFWFPKFSRIQKEHNIFLDKQYYFKVF